MTNFGKNIKKIRSIQKLSQSSFAEIFGLSRASIGAYEEGRAEPKLDIIVKIANHFSITVDQLINNEITVNELYHFNIFDESISKKANIGNEVLKKIEFINIPVIITHELLIKNIITSSKESQNYITLPHHTKEHLGILINRDGFKYLPKKVGNNDIIVVYSEFTLEKSTSLNNKLWLIKASKSLYLGELKELNNSFLFFPPDGAPIRFSSDEVDFMLPVETLISRNPVVHYNESERLRKLELQVNDLYNRL